ncbi:MAG TPA: hypothetical protein VHT75_03750 [Acidimicrobiales bacterium]|nr:hypothetical protein [Acidimicrobiales bacterium]
MPSDDELRRVAEDVRALARSLGRDIRAAIDRARGDVYGPPAPDGQDEAERTGAASDWGWRSARQELAAASRMAREELWSARQAVRESTRVHRRRRDEQRRAAADGNGPRFDNWGGRRYREAAVMTGEHPVAARRCRRNRHRGSLPEPVPVAPIRHRHDGSTLVGLLAVVFGLAWLAAAAHVASVSTEAVLAIALMVVGAATVVTARTDWALSGRTWPMIAGAAVAVVLLTSSAGLPVGFRHLQFGQRTLDPSAWTDLPAVLHGGFGRTQIDLSGLPTPAPAARTFAVDTAAGRLEIIVPNVPVIVHARMAAGQLQVNGVSSAGTDRRATETLNPTAPGPALTLNVDAGFGSVDISQAPVGGLTPKATEFPGAKAQLPPTPTVPTDPVSPVGPA